MNSKLIKSDSRGAADHGWLKTHHSFSFANYFDRSRMHFGNLRVLNDDSIAPGKGFGKHPHDNMEIVTIPLTGALMHEDSMGHMQPIGVDEVQHMSAGTGIYHSEFNASESEELTLLQLWIMPLKQNIAPTYSQRWFDRSKATVKWQTLVDPEGNEGLPINQNSKISRVFLAKGTKITYENSSYGWGNFLFVIEGAIGCNQVIAERRDAIELQGAANFEIEAIEDAYVLNIETAEYINKN